MSVLCLVPSALRAARAARRLCDAEGGLLFGARVETPDATAARVLAAAGDPRPVLTPLAERLLALEVGEVAGPPFAGAAPDGGVAATLASAIAELRRGDVTSAQAREAAAELGGRAGARLAQVASALAAYEARLAALGALDGAAALHAAADAVPRAIASEELRALDLLVLDGLFELSPGGFDLVAALAHRAKRTHARVPFFAERAELCSPAETLLRRLEGLHELAARREIAVVLPGLEPGRDRAPRLSRLLRGVAADAAPPGLAERSAAAAGADSQGAAEGRVLAACGAGEEGEAEAVARIVSDLLDAGFAADDVVVLAPSPARAAAPLARAMAAHGIAFAPGRGEPLDEAPAARALLAAFAAAAEPSRAALEGLATSAWFGVRAPARLGYWLDRAGALDVRGDPGEALRRRAAALSTPAAARERSALLASAEALDAVRSLLAPLATPATARDHAARLRALVVRSGARRRAARADLPVGRAALAAIARLEDAADEIVRARALVGRSDEALPVGLWASLLRLAASSRAVSPDGPAAGAVELWGVADAAGLSARAAVLTGCARGAFPPAAPAEPLLRDAERLAVNRVARRAALATGAQRRAVALYVGFSALAAGREALAVTWAAPGADGGGGPVAPLALEALAVAGVAPPAVPEPATLPQSRSPAEALRALARGARRDAGREALRMLTAASPALVSRAASVLARGALEAERRDAIAARRPSRGAGGLGDVLPLLVPALPAEWSPSQLEAHARCPYRLFAGMVLAIPERDGADLDIDPRDEGRLAHAVLERFLRDRRSVGALPLRGNEQEQAALRAAAETLFERFAADGRVGDAAVWTARRAAVLSRLARVVSAEAEEDGTVTPALLEYEFGGDSGVPPLVFGEGSDAVRVRGRLDRVDASADRLLLIDYKDTRAEAEHRKKLRPDALGHTNFQVPIYLLAAARALPGRAELSATYVLLRAAERLAPYRAAASDPFFAEGSEARAAARAAGVRPFADAVVDVVRSVRGGDLPIASRDCGGCPFGALCRAQALAEEAA